MTVEFPDDLVVANRGEVEERNLEPRREGRSLAVDGIQVPVDVFPGIPGDGGGTAGEGEIQIGIA